MLLTTKAGLRFCFERCNFCLLFSGKTALHMYSEAGDVDVCKLLVLYQADVNVTDNGCDARPLHMLLTTKAGLRFCFPRCNSCRLFSGRTALHWSSAKGRVEVCKLLVESQADVNVKDSGCDARPLHMLLETKAGLRFCFPRCNSCLLFSGETALHLSCEAGFSTDYVMICKLLVESHVDVNAKEK
jgi:ankyrin repeat protein